MHALRRLTIVAVVAALGVAGGLVGASADGNGAQTFNLQDHTATQTEPLIGFPCFPDGILTLSGNLHIHMTIRPDNTFSDTLTVAGDWSLVPLNPTIATFNGHFEDWNNDHGPLSFLVNGTGSVTSNEVLNAHGSNAQGTTIDAHLLMSATTMFAGGVPVAVSMKLNKVSC